MIPITKNITRLQDKYLFILSIIILIFSKMSWVEPTEWGYLIANINKLSQENTFYYFAIKDFSAVNYITAMLINLNLPIKLVNILIFSTIHLTAFYAAFKISKLFSQNNIKYVVPIILLFINLNNSHGYDVVYTNNFWVYGQFGMYLSLISIVFYYERKIIATLVILFILLFSHFIWFVCSLLFLFFFYLSQKKINFIKLSFFIAVIFFLIIFYKFNFNLKLFKQFIETSYLGSHYFTDNTLDGHNLKIFQENKSYILSLLDYLKTDLGFILMLFLMNKNNKYSDLLKVFILFTTFILLIKIYETIDYKLVLMQKIYLKEMYIRFIPERLFNLNTMFFYIGFLSFFLNDLLKKNYYIVYLTLIIFIPIASFYYTNNFGNNIAFNNLIFLIFLSLILFKNKGYIKILINISTKIKNNLIQIGLSVNSIFYFIIIVLGIMMILNNQYYFKKINQNKIIHYLNIDYQESTNIILGNGVDRETFNPMLQANRIQFIPNNQKSDSLNIYCSNNKISWAEWYSNVNYCLENKSNDEWGKIVNTIGKAYLILDKKYKPNLKLLVEDSKFNLYEIR